MPCAEVNYTIVNILDHALHLLRSLETVAYKFTAWTVSKYGFFSGPYFPTFELNMEK